jgi:hypothetical protein
MRVIIYYRDRARNRELPVVAMGFTRSQARDLGLPHYRPDLSTGSLGPGK